MSFPVPGGVSPGHLGGSSRSLIERSKAHGLAGKGAGGRLHSSLLKAEKMPVTRQKNEGSRPPSQVTGHQGCKGDVPASIDGAQGSSTLESSARSPHSSSALEEGPWWGYRL